MSEANSIPPNQSQFATGEIHFDHKDFAAQMAGRKFAKAEVDFDQYRFAALMTTKLAEYDADAAKARDEFIKQAISTFAPHFIKIK